GRNQIRQHDEHELPGNEQPEHHLAGGRWSRRRRGRRRFRCRCRRGHFSILEGACVSIRYGESWSERGAFMRVVMAPEEWTGQQRSLFLAGGISGCGGWQSRVGGLRAAPGLAPLNPRRANSTWHDPNAAEEQIRWEFRHLRKASGVLFWFPCETLCPIALYELGAWSMTDKPLFVGAHPEYARRLDLLIQTGLVRP